MSLFPNRSRPRSIQDIWIGKSHMVEILFHLRRNDYDWYNDNSIEIEEEIFDLLSDSIIPRMFGDIIEKYHAKRHPELFPDIVVDDDNKNGIGSKNIAKNSNYAKNKKQQQQRKKKGGGGKGKKSSAASTIDSTNDDNKKPDKDVYYSFGETVQLAYRKVPLSSPPIRTIFFKDNNNNNNNNKTDDDGDDDGDKKQGGSKKRDNKGNKKQQQLKDDDDYDDDEDQQNNKKKRKRKQQQQQQGPILMESRIKLPSKLLIWVSQIVDPNNKTNPDPSNVGFYRPEMIPICDLFREPKEEEEETI